jgi:hypothetical protein
MIGYKDGKLLRMKGKDIPRKQDFAGDVDYDFTYKVMACPIKTFEF